jgi:uncharacterized protein YndB with AHSA1/START domain
MPAMLWLILAAVGALVGGVVVWGACLPRAHAATVSREHRGTRARAWALVTGAEAFPRWRTGVKRVDVRERDASGAVAAWTEHARFGAIPMRVVERREPDLLVGRIDAEDLGFSGTWTYRLTDAGPGRVRVSITEDGVVANPVFRFLSRYVFGPTRTLEAFQRDLGAALAATEPPAGGTP